MVRSICHVDDSSEFVFSIYLVSRLCSRSIFYHPIFEHTTHRESSSNFLKAIEKGGGKAALTISAVLCGCECGRLNIQNAHTHSGWLNIKYYIHTIGCERERVCVCWGIYLLDSGDPWYSPFALFCGCTVLISSFFGQGRLIWEFLLFFLLLASLIFTHFLLQHFSVWMLGVASPRLYIH